MDYEFLKNLNSEMRSHFPVIKDIDLGAKFEDVIRLDSEKIGDKAIWVYVHENEYKGNLYYNAVFGNWREGSKFTFSSYDKTAAIANTKEFRDSVKRAEEIAKQKIEEERKLKNKLCREKYLPYFLSLPTNRDVHPYLKRKNIDSNFIARVSDRNVLFVPGYNAERFVGGQRIFFDPETNKFIKRYTSGIEKTGSFVPFGNVRTAKYIYIAEGFATASSIFMAFRGNENIAVIAAWDTSNLYYAAISIRSINPNCFIIYAADRDLNSQNVGERKAKFAASKLSNAIVIVAKFPEGSSSELSDFNDLHVLAGLDEVKNQLTVDGSSFIEIIPLGFNKDKYYYFNTLKKQIIEFNKGDHNANFFMLNAPRKYWGDRYGYIVKADGTNSSEPNWKKVIEQLGIESAEKGIFNNNKIRGLGAWEENGEIVVNVGDKLFFKNKYHPLFNNNLNSKYFYQATESLDIDFENALTDGESQKIVQAFKLLNYKNKSDFITLTGWIFSAQIFAALPWRPHLWLSGPRGSGKSTIIKYISDLIFIAIMIQNSTAAGIRQRLENSAIAINYDESEPDSEKGRERLGEVIEIARQTSTKSKYEILRGSAGGRVTSYNTNTIFCMSSIQIPSLNSADISRFFIVEMNPIKNQAHEKFVEIENAMDDVKDFAERLFVRAVRMYKTHIKNIETIKKFVKKNKIESRQADQLAPIIAGYWAYFSTGEITEKFITDTINEMNFTNSTYVQNNDENDDSEKCLNDILDLLIPSYSRTVGQVIDQCRETVNRFELKTYEEGLEILGIKFLKFENQIFIPSSNNMLKKSLERVSPYSDYKNLLMRHPAFVDKKNVRSGGKVKRGLIIQL